MWLLPTKRCCRQRVRNLRRRLGKEAKGSFVIFDRKLGVSRMQKLLPIKGN